MTSAGDILLKTNQLRIGYVHKAVENCLFDDLNLTLASGEMVCFMGPNGAGKSSLLRVLAGLQKPLGGSVETPASNRGASTQIAVVLTDRITAVNLTVEELVTFGRYPYLGWNIRLTPADRQIVDTAVKQVGLSAILKRKVYELSDGQLQMVMIARALAQDTPLILLDEPTAHLDLNNRLEIMNLLRTLSRETNKGILVATHELDLALQTADLIWLSGQSRSMLTGLPEDLVLNGSFDEIFRFKGFDLKTGKVQQRAFRGVQVQLVGEGPALLWTRNALERSGYSVSRESEEIQITLVDDAAKPGWIIKSRRGVREADSIETLLKLL